MDAYGLEEHEKELVRKGEYDPWDFGPASVQSQVGFDLATSIGPACHQYASGVRCPKRDLTQRIRPIAGGKGMSKKVIGFHKPEEPNGYLSNWYMSDFEMRRKGD